MLSLLLLSKFTGQEALKALDPLELVMIIVSNRKWEQCVVNIRYSEGMYGRWWAQSSSGWQRGAITQTNYRRRASQRHWELKSWWRRHSTCNHFLLGNVLFITLSLLALLVLYFRNCCCWRQLRASKERRKDGKEAQRRMPQTREHCIGRRWRERCRSLSRSVGERRPGDTLGAAQRQRLHVQDVWKGRMLSPTW